MDCDSRFKTQVFGSTVSLNDPLAQDETRLVVGDVHAKSASVSALATALHGTHTSLLSQYPALQEEVHVSAHQEMAPTVFFRVSLPHNDTLLFNAVEHVYDALGAAPSTVLHAVHTLMLSHVPEPQEEVHVSAAASVAATVFFVVSLPHTDTRLFDVVEHVYVASRAAPVTALHGTHISLLPHASPAVPLFVVVWMVAFGIVVLPIVTSV